jgi:hypothetical protein
MEVGTMARTAAQDMTPRRDSAAVPSGPDAEWVDEELAVDLEVDEELAFEYDDGPLRLVGDDADDRFASAWHDAGQYSAEELAMHLLD